MAFQVLKTYDFAANNVSIGATLIEGYGDDGGLEYSESQPHGEMTYGADGEATFSRNNAKGLEVTITLKETSNSVADLDELRRAQHASPGKIQPLPYFHRDNLTGDQVVAGYCVFMNHATPSKARQAGEREFMLHLVYAADNTLEGTTNFLPI